MLPGGLVWRKDAARVRFARVMLSVFLLAVAPCASWAGERISGTSNAGVHDDIISCGGNTATASAHTITGAIGQTAVSFSTAPSAKYIEHGWPSVDTTAPSAGTPVAPAYANATPIVITYSGASDSGGSGLALVKLWYKKGTSGAWTNSGLTKTTASGSFNFAAVSGDDTYYFGLQATDYAGNSSVQPSGNGADSTVYDTAPPVVTIGTPSGGPVNSSGTVSFPVTVSGASSINLVAGNVTINHSGTGGGSVTVQNGATASPTVEVTGLTGDGAITISIAAGAAADLAGNTSAAAGPSGSVTVDNTGPAVVIGTPSGGPINSGGTAQFPVTVTGAANINLVPGNVTINHNGTGGGSVTIQNGTTASPRIRVTGVTGNGSITVSIAANVATDAAGNASSGTGPSAAVAVDNTAPSVTSISAPSVSQTNSGPVSYTVTFNETVTGFDSAGDIDVQATGTAAPGTIAIAGSGPYTVTLSNIAGNGTLKIAVKAGAAADTAGNANVVSSASTAFNVDNILPTVESITRRTPLNEVTKLGTVTWLVTFAEAVYGLTPSDFTAVTVSGALTGEENLSVSAASGISVQVTSGPFTGSGVLRLDVLAASATIIDAVGNALEADYTTGESYSIDQAGPVIDPLEDRAVASFTPTISGSATDNIAGVASVNVRVYNGTGYDHAFAASVTPPDAASCSWSAAVNIALAEGDYTVTVTGTDTVGNAGAPESFTLTVDTSVPTTTVAGLLTSDTTPTLTGTATTQAPRTITQVNVIVDGVTYPATLLNSGSAVNWQMTIPAAGALADGIYSVTAEARNSVGLTGTGTPGTLTVDSTAPAVGYTPLATYAATVTLSGTLTEAVGVASMTVNVAGADHAVTPVMESGSEYSWSLDLGAMAEGSYAVTITSVDTVGNSAPATYAAGLIVDRTPPTGSVTIENGAMYTNLAEVALTLSGADALSGVAFMRFSADGLTWEPADWAAAPAFSEEYGAYVLSPGEGEKSVYVQLRDAAGNESTIEIRDTIQVDLTNPAITGVSAAPGEARTGDVVELSFTVSEALYGNPTVTVNGHDAEYVSGKAEAFTYSYAVTEEDEPGPATIIVMAEDLAGNQGVEENTDALIILQEAAGMPVAAWPLLLLAPGAAAWILRRRDRFRR